MIDQLQVQEHVLNEDQRIATAIAEKDAKQEKRLREEGETRTALLKSIFEHRERQVTLVQILPTMTIKPSHDIIEANLC